MRILMLATCVMMFCFSPSQTSAQNCKPNISGKDSISKQQVDRWHQTLFSTGFGSSLMNTSQVSIIAIVGRYGTVNSISVQIQKQEESKQNATLESEYLAIKGNQFYFGLKNSEPLAFVATEVSNETKAAGLLVGKLVTTVILSATVPDKDLATLRDALTRKQIDAVRIVLAGDVRIEKSVNDKDGKKMMEKFSCFYQSLDKRGIDLSMDSVPKSQPVRPASPSDGSVTGKYLRKDKSSDYIELDADGTFALQQDGKGYRGNYNVQDDTITVQASNAPASRLRISGNTMVESDGTVWEKQAEPQKPATHLTIDQIIQMVTAKLPDDIIIKTIQNSISKFDLTPDALIKLKTAGVSDAVIRAMTR
jgi:hypothetical protein